MSFGSSASGANALQQQQQQALTQGSNAIQKSFAGFTPGFYQGVQQSYQNQNLPQLFGQYRQNQQQLGYNLADRGLTGSSASGQLGSSLSKALSQGEQQVVNQGQSAAQSLEQQVANQQAQLYGQLANSQNPTATAQSAANSAAQSAAPSVFPPLGNMFSNWASTYLAGQNANTANTQMQWLYPYLLSNSFSNPGSGAITGT